MNTFAAVFLAECLKLRKGWAFLTALLGPVCQVGFLSVIVWYSEDRVAQFLPGFRFWIELNYVTWNMFFLPILVALVSDLAWGLEDDSKTWGHLLVQPLPRRIHYGIKLASGMGLLGLSQGLLFLLLIPAGCLLRTNPQLQMGSVPLELLVWSGLYTWIGSFGVVAAHTWIAFRVRGSWLGIAIGMLGTWLCIQLIDARLVTQFLPWGMAGQMAGLLQRLRPFPEWSMALGGLGSALLLSLLGTWDFVTNKRHS